MFIYSTETSTKYTFLYDITSEQQVLHESIEEISHYLLKTERENLNLSQTNVVPSDRIKNKFIEICKIYNREVDSINKTLTVCFKIAQKVEEFISEYNNPKNHLVFDIHCEQIPEKEKYFTNS